MVTITVNLEADDAIGTAIRLIQALASKWVMSNVRKGQCEFIGKPLSMLYL